MPRETVNGHVQDRLSRISALAPPRHREPLPEAPARESDDSLVRSFGAEIRRNRYGEHLTARQCYATPEMCAPDHESLRLLLPAGPRVPPRAAARAAHIADWLFLDTETTGIAGGTGTYAFLVGLAWWDAGGLQIEQLFMRDHAEEHSLLLEIAARLRERPVLVTFNGKSFDWPLLETRFRMTRAIEVPALAAHLDLLHPARQLWRSQLGSVRLCDLERHVLDAQSLGWSRSDDIDSSCIPQIYFDYLRGAPVAPLAGVFRHNRMDLRGLAALAGRIFRALAQPRVDEAEDRAPLELYGVSRLLDRRGERARARAMYEHALRAGLPASAERSARHELARLAKRDRDFLRAAELWRELLQDSGANWEASEQLAIYCERRLGDAAEAARLARSALAGLRRAQSLGLVEPARHARIEQRFARRLARLEEKLRQRNLSATAASVPAGATIARAPQRRGASLPRVRSPGACADT
jgi:uncharacterized protein